MAGRWQFLLVHVWPWHLAPAWGTDVLAAEVVVPVSLLGANTGMLHAGMLLAFPHALVVHVALSVPGCACPGKITVQPRRKPAHAGQGTYTVCR